MNYEFSDSTVFVTDITHNLLISRNHVKAVPYWRQLLGRHHATPEASSRHNPRTITISNIRRSTLLGFPLTSHPQNINLLKTLRRQTHSCEPASSSFSMRVCIRAVFLNRQAAARYRALASIIPGRERFS